jgi:hypothetical protein
VNSKRGTPPLSLKLNPQLIHDLISMLQLHRLVVDNLVSTQLYLSQSSREPVPLLLCALQLCVSAQLDFSQLCVSTQLDFSQPSCEEVHLPFECLLFSPKLSLGLLVMFPCFAFGPLDDLFMSVLCRRLD